METRHEGDDSRSLWVSNAPWAGTGYGQQTKLLIPALRQLGIDMNCFAFYGLSGNKLEYDGYTVYPNSDFDPYGNDVIMSHIHRSKSNIVLTLMDLFVLAGNVWSNLKVPWTAWVPLDAETIGPINLEILKLVDYPVAMSIFGGKQMDDVGIQAADVIYHAVDTETFHYREPDERRQIRQLLGIPEDAYVIGMVMANKGDRKQYPAQLSAIRKWIDSKVQVDPKFADRVRVFIHTEPTARMGGWDIKALIEKLGLVGRILTTNAYDTGVVPLPADMMAKLYSCFDVLMNCSAGEGFGIPIAEAQACGVPVITQDCTAMTEITINGYAVKSVNKGLAHHYGWQFNPDVEDMVYRLECIYRNNNSQAREAGIRWVQGMCGVDVIAQRWADLIEFILEDRRAQLEGKQTIMLPTHPTPALTTEIAEARHAMAAEADEYGSYHTRRPEYVVVGKELRRLGLRDGDHILDLGAGLCDLDRYLRETNWSGTYVPVDMIIDGTDLNHYDVPCGFEFIVVEQVIEHLDNWQKFISDCESAAGAVIVVTPNGEVVDEDEKHDFPHQMAHKHWLTPNDFRELQYETSLFSFTGRKNDTILATKMCELGAIDGDVGRDRESTPVYSGT